MKITNRSVGNHFEQEFCGILAVHGFWVHNLAQNSAGQPADVIAVKDGVPYLIDCKVSEGRYFSRNRIEENQSSAMHFWEECGNGEGWFAIRLMGEIFMVSLNELSREQKTNLNYEWFRARAFSLAEWLSQVAKV